jgi:hypothetical protein
MISWLISVDVLGNDSEFGEELVGGSDEFGEELVGGSDEFGEELVGGSDEFGEELVGGSDEPMPCINESIVLSIIFPLPILFRRSFTSESIFVVSDILFDCA